MNISSRTLLVSGFALLLLLMLLIIMTGLGYSSANNSRMEQIVNVHNIRAIQINQLRSYSRELSVLYYQMLLVRDPFALDEIGQKVSTFAGEFLKVYEELMQTSTRQEDRDKLSKLMSLASRTYNFQKEVIALLQQEKYAAATTLMVNKVQPSQNESVNYYDYLVKEQQQLVADAAMAAQSTYRQSFLLMLLISSIAILLGVIISVFVVRKTWKAELVLKRGKIELEKLVQERTHELHQLANTDELTGIFNRRKFSEVLQIEFARGKRYGNQLSVIILDVDHFKVINDTYGHHMGDIVLQKLAQIISASLRDNDIFARWGGEEFIILAPCGESRQPDVLAERLRSAVENFVFGDAGKVSCSFGVTAFRFDDDQDSMINRADHNLYQAKNSGRNRVCFN
ncbi:MAG: diguanylate cyclase [Gallionellaceae bacterium]|jgi:diguanylate cyclase (GGDEF)-like protein